ncbi:hypothetical protein NHX12_025949, partial [Muraenolepis orangiensis]
MDFDPLMNPASPKRRRCAPIMSTTAAHTTSSPQKYLRMEPSPFGEVVSSRLTTEQILHNIKQEYKRLQKRRHLDSGSQQADGCCPVDLHSGPSGSCSTSPTRKEQPLFSLRQVGMICERLLKEREEKIREEYNEILTSKLAGADKYRKRNLYAQALADYWEASLGGPIEEGLVGPTGPPSGATGVQPYSITHSSPWWYHRVQPYSITHSFPWWYHRIPPYIITHSPPQRYYQDMTPKGAPQHPKPPPNHPPGCPHIPPVHFSIMAPLRREEQRGRFLFEREGNVAALCL